MLLLSQVDEPTFNELSKRLHQKMKKDHGLQMPLSKLREVMIQSVGHRSLHDARKSWKTSLHIARQPNEAALVEKHESLEHTPSKARAISQKSWATPPKPWREVVEAIKNNALVAWSHQHPGVLQKLSWREKNENHLYTDTVTVVDLLLRGGPTEWNALKELVETQQLSVTPEQWKKFMEGMIETPPSPSESASARELLTWMSSTVIDKKSLWDLLPSSILHCVNPPEDQERLLVPFQGILEELEQVPLNPYVPGGNFTHRLVALLPTKGVKLTWAREIEFNTYTPSPLNSRLVIDTLFASKTWEAVAFLQEENQHHLAWRLMATTACIALSYERDHSAFLEFVLASSPPKHDHQPAPTKHPNETASMVPDYRQQDTAKAHLAERALASLLSALLTHNHPEDFLRLLKSPACRAVLRDGYGQHIGQSEIDAAMRLSTSKEIENQVWEAIFPLLTENRESGDLWLRNSIFQYVSQLEKNRTNPQGEIPTRVMGNIKRILSAGINPTTRYRDLRPFGTGTFLQGAKSLPDQTLFGGILMETGFSTPWLRALDNLQLPWNEPIVGLPDQETQGETRWVTPLAAALLMEKVDLLSPPQEWVLLGSTRLADSSDLSLFIHQLFRRTSDPAMLTRFIQTHGLENHPIWEQAWKSVMTTEQAAWLTEHTTVRPTARDMCFWAYHANERAPSTQKPKATKPGNHPIQDLTLMVQYALAQGVDVSKPVNEHGETVLHWMANVQAVGYPSEDPVIPLLQCLIEAGANPLAESTHDDGENRTAVQWACPERSQEDYYQARIAYLHGEEMSWVLNHATSP